MRPHPRHADTDPRAPRAWATCDRCGQIWNHYKLEWQYEWGGARPYNERILVCEYCRDEMQEQFKSVILPPDPPSIMNPRPENIAQDVLGIPPWNVLTDEDGNPLQDGNGNWILAEP